MSSTISNDAVRDSNAAPAEGTGMPSPLDWDEKLAEAVADAIKRAGITQAELSRRSGVPAYTISRLLNAKTRKVDFRVADLLSDALSVQLRNGPLQAVAREALPIPVVDQKTSTSLRGGMTVDHVWIPRLDSSASQHVIALSVSENSLAPEIVEGDYVIVDMSLTAESGNPVVALVDGVLHVKRYRVRANGSTVLVSEGGDIPIEPRQIEGVIIGFWRGLGRWAHLQ